MDIDEKILEKNKAIGGLITYIDLNFNHELCDCRDLEEDLKESALERLDELENKLGEAAEVLMYTVDYFKEEEQ